MSELKVVQSNDFIRKTNWTLEKTPLKLLKWCIAYIDTNNPPANNTIVINKSDFLNLMKRGSKNSKEEDYFTNSKYYYECMNKLITSVRVRDDDKKAHNVALVTDIEWNKENDDIGVTFHKDVMPYLINLKEKFLQYDANVLPYFKTKAGLILFENLLSREKQYGGGTHEISIDELRAVTNTQKKYKEFREFNRRILEAAKNDINQSGCEILIDYKKITKNRKVDSIVFYVAKRNHYYEKTYDEAIHNKQMKEQQ